VISAAVDDGLSRSDWRTLALVFAVIALLATIRRWP
jgi:hypothetical protein